MMAQLGASINLMPDFNDGGQDLIDGMESARQIIETKFLEAGNVLSQSVEGLGSLISALDRLGEALGPAATAAASEQLSRAAAKLSALPGQQTDRRGVIGTLNKQRAALAERMDDMRRNLAYMRAYTMNIKITAGGIASADGEFGVFAQEISSQIEAGRREVDALDRDLTKLGGDLKGTLAQADEVERRCASLIPSVPDQLLASADLMGRHHARIATSMAEAGAVAREIRKKVARILAALQVGDITRQRIEHVQAGVQMLAATQSGLGPGAGARLQDRVHVLLAAQLDATLEDFNREVGQILDGLAGLARDAGALLRLRDLAYGGETGDSNGFLRTLELRVQEAVGLAGEIETADTAAKGAGASAGLAAQALSARLTLIQTIKADVTYMALNTALKSSRIGEAGRPLSTIASELRVQAGQLESTADICVGVLGVLVAAASALTGPSVEDEGESAGDALLAATTKIKTASDLAEQDVAALGLQGQSVMTLLTKSCANMGLQTDIAAALTQAALNLTPRVAPKTADVGDDIRGALGALLAKLAAIYTMAQEREVQKTVIATWGVGIDSTAAPVLRAVETELDDVLF